MNIHKNDFVGYEFSKSSLTGSEMLKFLVVSQKGNVVNYVRVRNGKPGTVTIKCNVRDLPCNQPE